jgi:hypothetical protein
VAKEDVLTDAVAQLARIAEMTAANTKPRKMTTHEYMQSVENRSKLTRTVYMGGAKLRESSLSNAEVVLLNKLRAGKYNGGRWTVLERNKGGSDGGAIDIFVPNATQEDRVRMAMEAPTLTALCTKIIEEFEANKKVVQHREVSGLD